MCLLELFTWRRSVERASAVLFMGKSSIKSWNKQKIRMLLHESRGSRPSWRCFLLMHIHCIVFQEGTVLCLQSTLSIFPTRQSIIFSFLYSCGHFVTWSLQLLCAIVTKCRFSSEQFYSANRQKPSCLQALECSLEVGTCIACPRPWV